MNACRLDFHFRLHAGIVSKWLNGSIWHLVRKLPMAYPTLGCNGIRIPPNIRTLLSGTLSQTLNLAEFSGGFSLRQVDHRKYYQLRSTVAGLSLWAPARPLLFATRWPWDTATLAVTVEARQRIHHHVCTRTMQADWMSSGFTSHSTQNR